MNWTEYRGVYLVAIVCLLLAASGGCRHCVRHGWILRGDWSLEMNRVPWLLSRTDAHEECSEDVTVCSPGCPLGAAIGSREEVTAECAGDTPTLAQPAASDTACGTCRGAICRLCRGRGGAVPTQPTIAEGYDGRSRFHPVPTRPVFLPRTDQNAAIPDETEWAEPDPSEAVPPETEPAPLPRPVEVIPAPEPETQAKWQAKQSGEDGEQSEESSWVFSPSASSRPAKTARAQPSKKPRTYSTTTK